MESWSQHKMEDAGLFYTFVQDNQSYSAKKGTLRDLLFKMEKLLRPNWYAVPKAQY